MLGLPNSVFVLEKYFLLQISLAFIGVGVQSIA
jgi:hypothetical protein